MYQSMYFSCDGGLMHINFLESSQEGVIILSLL